MTLLQEIANALENGADDETADLTRKALAEGLGAAAILEQGLLAGMKVVGDRFRVHEVFLPDVLLSARAMYAGLNLVKPLLARGEVRMRGRVVIGTVRGDLHDIGKNLVGIMLQGAGFEVVDLGRDVPPEAFVDAAEREGCQVIGLSALLTTTMTGMKDVVDLVKARGLGGRVKTIVGGAPLSAEFAKEIGADAYAFDAATAVERVGSLVETSVAAV